LIFFFMVGFLLYMRIIAKRRKDRSTPPVKTTESSIFKFLSVLLCSSQFIVIPIRTPSFVKIRALQYE
jgi:hypothetical protein